MACSLNNLQPAFELWFFSLYQESLLIIFLLQCVSLQAPLDHRSEMSLSDSGFEPGGKRNFLHLTDKDGEQPQLASVSLVRSTPWVLQTKNVLINPICVFRMNRELLIAVGWMTALRSASLGPSPGMAL